jgi:hypothetical protein
VTVLAFMDGDEAFVDANGNNRFDQGEAFTDQGQPFLDFNESGTFDAGEQKVGDASVPGSGVGNVACPSPSAPLAGDVPNTCDGVWGPTRIRQQIVIAFSGSTADITNAFSNISASSVDVTIRDDNRQGGAPSRNPLPKGTQVIATASGGLNCSVSTVRPATVPNALAPTTHRILLSATAGGTCSGATLNVSTQTPLGTTTLFDPITLP